jgi:hypothetical protein
LVCFDGESSEYPGNLVRDNHGNLYGTCSAGLFELPLDGNAAQNLGAAGAYDVLLGPDGNIYGASRNVGEYSPGNLFEFVASTNTVINLYNFGGSPIGISAGGLIMDSSGDLYGYTNAGGTAQEGSVFELTPTTITGRYVFYNDSVWDGNDPAPNANDLNAIATDKTALLPGGSATYASITDYSKGINGVIVDISNLPGSTTLTSTDFKFATGNSNDTTTWTTLATSPTVTEIPGTGGISHVDLTWPDGTITNTWLQVTVLADANTGLATNDVFYFGNLIGEVGNSTTLMQVTAVDLVLNQLALTGSASITNPYDINRDGRVSAVDLVLTQNNSFQSIQLITPTGNGPSISFVAATISPAAVSASAVSTDDHQLSATSRILRHARRKSHANIS